MKQIPEYYADGSKICDICNEDLPRGDGYLLHGKLVAQANPMSDRMREMAAMLGLPFEKMQAEFDSVGEWYFGYNMARFAEK
jgi:hypothetical protein